MQNKTEFQFKNESKKLVSCVFTIEKSNDKDFKSRVIVHFKVRIGSEISAHTSTHLMIDVNDWDKQSKRIKGKSLKVRHSNKYLDNIEEEVYRIYYKLRETNDNINPRQIKEIIMGKSELKI
jgi:acetyl-CoA carboxylase beta subunit